MDRIWSSRGRDPVPKRHRTAAGELNPKQPAFMTAEGFAGQHGPDFAEFTRQAGIRPLPAGYRFPRPVSASHFNDDVKIEIYESAPFAFSDTKRKGVRGALACLRDLQEQVPVVLGEITDDERHTASTGNESGIGLPHRLFAVRYRGLLWRTARTTGAP